MSVNCDLEMDFPSQIGFSIMPGSLFPRASLIAQLVKNPPAMEETAVRFLGQKGPLEKG